MSTIKSTTPRIFALASLFVFFGLGLTLQTSAQSWYNPGWSFRKSHTITASAGAGTNYQVMIIAHKATGTDNGSDVYLGSNVKDDFGDIRFTSADGTTLLSHWMQSSVSATSAVFWVKVSGDLNSDQTIFIYYGNAAAATTSNAAATFIYYDDGSSTSGWTISGNAGSSAAQGNPVNSLYAQTKTGGGTGTVAGQHYMSKNIGLVAGTFTFFNVRTNAGNLGNFYFLCNAAGAGQMYRLDARAGTDYTGFATTTAWNTWTAPGASQTSASNTWYQFGIAINAAGNSSTLYYDQGASTNPLPGTVLNSTTYAVTNNGGYIGLGGDAVGGNLNTYWDNIITRKYISPEPAHAAWGTQEPIADPVATQATNITGNGFSANWNAVANATGYRLDVSTSSNFATFYISNLDVSNVLTYSVTIPDTGPYYYRVRAYNTNGTSGNSNTITVLPPAGGDYRSASSGNWKTLATWQRFNGSTWDVPTAVQGPPTHNSGKITIRSGHTITVASTDTVDQVTVDAGGKVIVNNVTLTIANDTDAFDFTVNGSLEQTSNASAITTTGALAFGGTGTYIHNRNGGTIPTATWNANSTCLISGITITAPSGLTQSYSNFTWNCPGQTININLNGSLTNVNGDLTVASTAARQLRLTATTNLTMIIGGDLNISAGTLNFASGAATTKILNLGGSYKQTGGTFTNSNANVLTIVFTGSGKTFTQSAGTLTNTYINWIINSGASVTMNNNIPVATGRTCIVNGTLNCGNSTAVTGPGTFTLAVGGTLIMGSPNGISSGTTPSGNIQTNGARTFNSAANYIYNASGTQSTGPGLPLTVNSLTVAGNSDLTLTNSPTFASPLIVNNALTINPGAKLTIGVSQAVTVNGTLLNSVPAHLVIKSDATGTGSLKHNTSGVYATAERYITAANWTNSGNGWHLISSPTAAPYQDISGAWTPSGAGNDYDFYALNETTTWEYWLNQKIAANNITHFIPGTGYLVAYQQSGASPRTFEGPLNTADITRMGLTNTPASSYPGFHLVGNPFACAIDWNTGSWTKTNIDANAYVWKNGAYVSTAAAGNNFIPSMNGFMVHVSTNNTGTLTIPADARVHNTTNWYKSGSDDIILLKANDIAGEMTQTSIVRFNAEATADYDSQFDSYFVSGYAPLFYSVTSGKNYLLNTLPELTQDLVIPFAFVKNTSQNFSIELAESVRGAIVILEDKKTNTVQNLTDNPVYSFTAAEGDDANRFLLHFSGLGTPEVSAPESFTVSQNNGTLYITTQQPEYDQVMVANMLGQVVLRGETNGNTLTALNAASLPNGVYIVSLLGKNRLISKKIFISR